MIAMGVIYFVLGDSVADISVAAVNCPAEYIERLEALEVKVIRMTEEDSKVLFDADAIIWKSILSELKMMAES